MPTCPISILFTLYMQIQCCLKYFPFHGIELESHCNRFSGDRDEPLEPEFFSDAAIASGVRVAENG